MHTRSFSGFRRLALAVAGTFAALTFLPSKADAALIQDIYASVRGSPVPFKAGTIEFPSESGSTKTGVVFSYEGFPEWTEADIKSISWSLDTSTWDILSLSLQASRGDGTCPDVENETPCDSSSLSLTASTAATSLVDCSIFEDEYVCLFFTGLDDIEFRHDEVDVPEPPALWTFTLALLALVAAAHWDRRRRPLAGGLSGD